MASLSESLWHRNQVLAQAALEHPFVQGIASGELAQVRFAYYVGQDAAFLESFCRAYALALAKSPDEDGLIAFRELLDAAADELRLHQSYAARWGSTFTPCTTRPPRRTPTSCWRWLRWSRLATSRRR